MPERDAEAHSTGGFSTFGVIGYGHIGEFFARSFAEHGTVLVTDTDPQRLSDLPEGVRPEGVRPEGVRPEGVRPDGIRPNSIRAVPLAEVLHADVVVVAVPYPALEAVLLDIRDQLPPTTVVMDVTSTKVHPTELLRTVLAGHPNRLATHPLFGPPSMPRIEPGLRMIVTHTEGPRAKELRDFFEHVFGLELIEMSAEEHDRAMAYMQALPFFIARAIADLDIGGQLPDERYLEELAIPSFEKLWRIVDIEAHHSPGMFETSQQSNPYADDARRHFLEVIERLQADLARDASDAPDEPDAPE